MSNESKHTSLLNPPKQTLYPYSRVRSPAPSKTLPPPPFPLIQNILKISFYSRSRSSKVHLRTTRNWRCDAMREIRMDG